MTDTLPLSGSAQAAAVLEKLEARQEARRAEREQRQQELELVADPREDIDKFLTTFSVSHSSLQQRCCDLKQRAASAAPEEEKQDILQQLEDNAAETNDLERKVSDAAYFLPPYELRSCNNHLQQLRVEMAAIKQLLQPKRKFAFSRAVKKTSAPSIAADSTQYEAPVGQAAAAGTAGSASVQQHSQQVPIGPSAHDMQLINAGHGCMGLRDQTIVKTAQHLAGQAFVLHDLAGCKVFLLGHLSALRLQQLRDCRVYTGPVSGATFVNGASSCTLMIASHQVRIHEATNCDFYLRVRSRPIIEHSTNLRFAPYQVSKLSCPQQQRNHHQQKEDEQPDGSQLLLEHQLHLDGEQQQQQSHHQQQLDAVLKQQMQQQIDELLLNGAGPLQQLFGDSQLAGDNELWQQVDDFGWVKATQSPNWSVVPEQQRQQPPLLPDCNQ